MKKLFIIFCFVLMLFLTSCSKKVEIIFDSMGGSNVATITNEKDFDVSKLPTPTKEGYTFEGWFLESTHQTAIVGNVPKDLRFTLYAKWKALSVTYKVEHYQENVNDNNYTLIETENLTDYTGTLVQANLKTYVGYSENKTHPARLFSANVLGNGSLVLKVYYQRETFTISYIGEETNVVTVKYDADIIKPNDPIKVGHTFVNWIHLNDPFTFGKMPRENITLTAQWTRNSYKIEFISHGEISITSITALYDDVINAPVMPIRNGYDFVGWFEDEAFKNQFTFDKMPAKNFTLYAKWAGKPATMNFDSMGGEIINPITSAVGSPIAKPTAVKTGHSFVNWYLDSTCTQLFDVWTMPVNGVKLYAKWNANSYTITFDTMGGSDVTSLSALYNTDIIKPNNPTKAGFVFEGWYLDSNYQEPFDFNKMPLDTTLYAKWVDGSQTKQISYIKKQKDGSSIEVEGIVFAILDSEYQGFYIIDDTGYIFILGNQNLVQIGDKVSVKGFYNNSGIINGVSSNISVISSGKSLPPKIEDLKKLSNLPITFENIGAYYETNGVITSEVGKYYLVDISGARILLDHRFTNGLDAYIGSKGNVELVLTRYEDIWVAGFISFNDEEVFSNTEKATKIKTYLIDNYLNKTYNPGVFASPKIDLYNWGTISYKATGTNTAFYDATNHALLDVPASTAIDFEITITVDDYILIHTCKVVVNPVSIISISDFLNLEETSVATIQGIVIVSDNYIVIQDNTASIFMFYNEEYHLETGDQIIITSRKYLSLDMYFLDANEIIDLEINNREVKITNLPQKLTDLNILNVNDRSIYGRYVNIRGFLKIKNQDDFYLDVNGKQIYIEPVNYNAAMEILNYVNLEVEIRGFIAQKELGEYYLVYFAHRFEINIPNYTDQEMVNVIQKIFSNQYGQAGFNSLDTFVFPSQLPMYNAFISWQMSPESRPYFNEETQQFMVVENDVPINIDITIVKNSAVANIRYSVILHPLDTLTGAEFKELDLDEEVFIEGLITYWHPNYFYLLVDNELIFANIGGIDAYKGDRVIIYGIKQHGLYSNEVEIYNNYDSDLPVLIAILDRENDVTTPMETTSIPKIISEDFDIMSTKTRYVQISGYLELIQYDFDLTYGNETIKVRTVDEYTFHELQGYRKTYVYIKGYLKSYEGKWHLMHTGIEGEVTNSYTTDNEKFNIIVANYTAAYNLKEFDANSKLNFKSMYNLFGESVNIIPQGTNANLIDVETGIVENVTAPTSVELLLSVKVGTFEANAYFTIIIIPTIENAPQLQTIAEFKLTTGGTYTIQGTVIAVGNGYDKKYALIKDSTGLIYLNTDYSQPQIYLSDVGRTIDVTGRLSDHRGRLEIASGSVYKLGTATTDPKAYETVTLSKLTSLDNRDNSFYGKAISVKGQLVKYAYGSYYLTDGNNRINVIGDYDSMDFVSKYEGYEIEVKAYFYGYLGLDNEYSILFNRSNSVQNITVSDYTNEEIVNMQSEDILNKYGKGEYKPFEEIRLVTSHRLFSIQYNYQITEGGEFVDYFSPYVKFKHNDTDQEIKISCTITYNDYSKTIDLIFILKGYPISNLEDLFESTEDTKAIYLQAIVIYSNYNYCYFMVDGNLYYLNRCFDEFIEAGTTVILSGKKTNINGVVDYTYDIEYTYISGNNDISVEPVSTNLNSIYNSDYSYNYIYPRYLNLHGILRFNRELDLLYLEYEGKKVYLRTNVLTNDYAERRAREFMSFYELEQYIDEFVYIDVFFPNLHIFEDYYVVDFRGRYDEIRLPAYTPVEDVNLSIDKFLKYYSSLTIMSGDRINLPYRNEVHFTSFNCQVLNVEDEKYLSFSYLSALIVNSPKEVTVNVVATHETGIIQNFTINITINPRPITPIREVVWGNTNQTYIIQGVVQLTRVGSWILLKDDTDSIYIETNKVVAIGDTINVLGNRSTYRTKHFVPIFGGVNDIDILSQGSVVPPIPTRMSFKDILSLDYLNPDIYNQYIILRGYVLSTGNADYPCYELIDDTYGVNYTIEMVGTNYKEFNDMMKAYERKYITIKGYLFGFEYIYDPCDWYILFDGLVSTD